MKSCSPSILFIGGAPKAGTFSLFSWLTQHPQIGGHRNKEPKYYADYIDNGIGIRRVDDFDRYIKYSDASVGTSYFIDASPCYLRCRTTPERVSRDLASGRLDRARFLFVLRDPVDRAFSNYSMDVKQGHQRMPFIDAFEEDRRAGLEQGPMRIQYEYYWASCYSSSLNQFINTLGFDNIKVIDFAELQLNPADVCRHIEEWLGLTPYRKYDLKPQNESFKLKSGMGRFLYQSSFLRVVRSALVPEWMKERLKPFFYAQPDAQQWQEMRRTEQEQREAARLELAKYFQDDMNNLARMGYSFVSNWPSYKQLSE